MIFTRETLGMTILLFCAIVLLSLFSGRAIFAGFGAAICTFMYGTFGYGCFLVMALVAYLGVWLAFEKKLKLKAVPTILAALTVYALFLLFHAVSTRNQPLDGGYIAWCYNIAAEGFPHYTFGGVLSAILVYPVALVTTYVGAYIIFSILAVLGAVYTVKSIFGIKWRRPSVAEVAAPEAEAAPASGDDYQTAYAVQPEQHNGSAYADAVYAQPAYQQPVQQQYAAQPVQEQYAYGQQPPYGYAPAQQPAAQPVQPQTYFTTQHMAPDQHVQESDSDKFSPEKLGRRILFDNDEFAAESYRRNGIFDENSYFNHPINNSGDYMRGFSDGKPKGSQPKTSVTYSEAYSESVEKAPSQPLGGMLYGDAPAQKLSDDAGSYSAEEKSSYTAPSASDWTDSSAGSFGLPSSGSDDYRAAAESPSFPGFGNDADNREEVDFGAPETEIDGRDELSSDTRGSEVTPDFGYRGADLSDSRDMDRQTPSSFESRRLDGALFGTPDQSSRSEDAGLRSDNLSRRETSSDYFGSSDLGVSRRGGEQPSSPQSDRSDAIPERGLPERGEDRRIAGFGESPLRSSQPAEKPEDSVPDISAIFSSSNPRFGEGRVEPDISRLTSGRDRSNANLFDDDQTDGRRPVLRSDGSIPLTPEQPITRASSEEEKPSDGREIAAPGQPVTRTPSELSSQPSRTEPFVGASGNVPSGATPPVPLRTESSQPTAQAPAPEKQESKPHVWKRYVPPTLDLLEDYPENTGGDTAEIEVSKRIITDTLRSFKVDCEVMDVIVAPALTRYDIAILDKTSIKPALLKYKESIAMALRKENVNAYLNFKKGALSVEVPNSRNAKVGLKGMMLSPAFTLAKPKSLTFALGKNLDGACVCPDIAKMPHLLVAGTSGSGKSVCLNSLLVSLLYKYGPEDLRLILVDPKQVEFISYDRLPHLMINEIIIDIDKAIKALNWAIKEMERRFTLFKDMSESGAGAKDGAKIATKEIDEFNAHRADNVEKLPRIVIVLDEFGDLMLQAKKDIEGRIIKLVQKGRAAGIHLILATQRPSVDCITGLIKSNLAARIGFKVGSMGDSMTIFDRGGAEKLLGSGDMYYRAPERPDPLQRIQGCFIDGIEVQRVTEYIKEHNESYFDQSVSDFINRVEEPEAAAEPSSEGGDDTKIDDTFIKALKYCVFSNAASVSMIQRRFPIGYIKACKIVDWMENMNYITKSEGSKPRKVLLSQEEFFNTYGDVDD